MPSAFKRGPRTIPTTTAATAAGPSKEWAPSALASSSSSSSVAATPAAAPPSTWQSRPTTHATLRPSPFPSQLPLPLFSLGLDSINDVFTGVGLPSASLALFLPHQDGEDEDERTRVGAAQGYADLICKYAAAQGVAAGQRVVVVGEGAEEWTKGLMGWAGQEGEAKVSRPEPAPSISAAAPQPPAEEDKLKVAFRYERLKKINDEAAEQAASSSSSTGSTQPYVHPFDLSTRISPRVLQKAKEEGRLVVHSIADEDEEEEGRADVSGPSSRDSYSEAWEVIQRTVTRWQQESSSDDSPLPARIILPSLGSPSWRIAPGRTHAGEAYGLLLRIKTLLRQTAWPSTQSSSTQTGPAMPIIAISSPSAWLLLSGGSGADTSHRLASLSDGALSFSSFAADPRTRFLAEPPASSPSNESSDSNKSSHFTGALRVLRTPAIGSLRGPSIRASALRGMASVSGGAGGGGGEGGSSENALGFKVRRKGVKVDVMGRDLVANWGAGEGDGEGKKAPKQQSEGDKKGAAAAAGEALTPPKGRTAGAPSVSVGIEEAATAAAAAAPTPAPTAAPAQGQQSPVRTPLKGLAALRARGLAAQGADKGDQAAASRGGAAAKQTAVHGANHDW